jgi:hypothetical protein
MNQNQKLELILDYINKIEILQPWSLGVDADYTALESIHNMINKFLNPEVYEDGECEE